MKRAALLLGAILILNTIYAKVYPSYSSPQRRGTGRREILSYVHIKHLQTVIEQFA